MFPNVVDVVYNNDPVHAKNILFLSDGFTAAEEPMFDNVAREIAKRFFRIAPFWLGTMRYRFNMFKCFTPSSSSGITINGYIDNNDDIHNAIGAGAKGKLVHQHSQFYLENNKPRELTCSPGHDGDVQAAVDALQYADQLKDPSNVLSVCWKSPDLATQYKGRDFGLVVVLVNEDFYGGCAITVSARQSRFALVSLGGILDYKILKPNLVNPLAAPKEYDHTPDSLTRSDYGRIVDLVIHEICHSHFGLADEYEDPSNNLVYNAGIPNIESAVKVPPANVPTPPPMIKWDQLVLYPGCVDANNKDRRLVAGPISRWYVANKEPLVKKPVSDGSPPDSHYVDVEPPLHGLASFEKGQPKWDSLKRKVKFLGIEHPEMLIGLFQGGGYSSTDYYRPAGICKMRVCTKRVLGPPDAGADADFDLCYVCKDSVVKQTADSLRVGADVKKAMLKDLAENLDPARKWRKTHNEDDDV